MNETDVRRAVGAGELVEESDGELKPA